MPHKRNMVNPVFRLRRQAHRKVRCRNDGQRNAGGSKGRSVTERIEVATYLATQVG
jgi:hypothetical protein